MLIISNCKSEDHIDNLILGTWYGVDAYYNIEDSTVDITDHTWTFYPDGMYTYTRPEWKHEGRWYLYGDLIMNGSCGYRWPSITNDTTECLPNMPNGFRIYTLNHIELKGNFGRKVGPPERWFGGGPTYSYRKQ